MQGADERHRSLGLRIVVERLADRDADAEEDEPDRDPDRPARQRRPPPSAPPELAFLDRRHGV
jgi:hypothetical protein